MTELALYDVERDALAGHLDGVRVSELMWRKAPADTRPNGEASAALLAQRPSDHGRPASGRR